jgi:hypothetical protein
MEPRNRFQGINSASLCSLAGRYDNPIPTKCLAPIDFLKISAQNFKKKNSSSTVIRCVLPICQDIAYSFCFTGAETEIHKIKDNSKIIRPTNLDRRGLRPIPVICHILDPPSFSLPTTFKLFTVPSYLKTSISCK